MLLPEFWAVGIGLSAFFGFTIAYLIYEVMRYTSSINRKKNIGVSALAGIFGAILFFGIVLIIALIE